MTALGVKERSTMLETLRSGCSREDAALRAGVTRDRLIEILALADRQRADGPKNGAALRLLQDIEVEEAKVRVRLHANAVKQADGDWRAATALLANRGRSPTPGPGGHLTLLDRVRRTQRIAALRAKGETWPAVAADVSLSVSACKAAYRDWEAWDIEVSDPMAIIDQSIAIRGAVINRLDQLAEQDDNPSARVGALKAMLEADRERLELMQAAGRLPRNLSRFAAEVEFGEIVREMVAVLRRRGVPAEVMEEVLEMTERFVPDRSNVTELRPRR